MSAPKSLEEAALEGYYAIDIRDARPGDLLLWYRGRCLREIVENDSLALMVVARNGPWKGSAQPVRQDSWQNVNIILSKRRS